MTTELAPIDEVVFAECPDCDATLMVSPNASLTLIHNADGSHGYDPDASDPKDDAMTAPEAPTEENQP